MRRVEKVEDAVDAVIAKVGKKVIVGTPLAAGKPNHFLNALYRRACQDSSIELTLLTALTLQKPKGKSDLESRFLDPFVERIFSDYPDLDYESAREGQTLPSNIRIIEFYLPPGKYSSNPRAQQDYLSTNYTHAVRDVINRDVNVVCQQVCLDDIDGTEVASLSCNPDITIDIAEKMRKKSDDVIVVGQTNQNLPFMYGESVVPLDFFDVLIDNRELDYKVFGPPKMSVSNTDYMIGLHASTLIKDDGEIQIGIGSLGDALVYSLIERENNNETYRDFLKSFDISDTHFPILKDYGSLERFKIGLFAATEMFVDCFANLYQQRILKKKVYDSVILQRLLNEGKIKEEFGPNILQTLIEVKAIGHELSQEDFEFLKDFGILKSDILWDQNSLILPSGKTISLNLLDLESRRILEQEGLGNSLRNGAVAHAGFFLGPQSFYEFLKDLPTQERKLIRMKTIANINHLYGHEEIDRLQRKNGRFLNTCMKVSLNGSACSDALDNNIQVSGVGGQFNFVSMAHELPDARSILQLRSWRYSKKGTRISNIVYSYANCTVPRHLRDIVITEYGIADLRGKTDEEVAIALIHITDSQFQEELLEKAKTTGKVRRDYKIPERFSHNTPEHYGKILSQLKKEGHFPAFPLGCDFTDEEIKIGKALKYLKGLSLKKINLIKHLVQSLGENDKNKEFLPLLERMRLAKPQSLKEKIYQKMLLRAFKV